VGTASLPQHSDEDSLVPDFQVAVVAKTHAHPDSSTMLRISLDYSATPSYACAGPITPAKVKAPSSRDDSMQTSCSSVGYSTSRCR